MTEEPLSLQGFGQITQFQRSWTILNSLLNTETPDESVLPQWIEAFTEARRWGEKYVSTQPASAEKMDMVKEAVTDIHNSLHGLEDIETHKNQLALFHFWFGLFYVDVHNMPEWGVESQIEFLEIQALPALVRALQCAPNYSAASGLLRAVQDRLQELRGRPSVRKFK